MEFLNLVNASVFTRLNLNVRRGWGNYKSTISIAREENTLDIIENETSCDHVLISSYY